MNVRLSESESFLAVGRARPNQPGTGLARSLGPLYLLGPVVAIGSTLVQRTTPGQSWRALVVVVVIAWVLGLAMLSGRLDSLRPNFFLAAAYLANVLLSLGIYFMGVSDFGLVFLYLWEIPFAFHYFGFRRGLMLVAFSALCYGILVIVQFNHGAPLRSGRWFALTGTALMIGLSAYQLSQAARRSQQRFRSIFEHGSFGMALMDAEGKVLEVNPALQRMLGRTAPELQGERFREYVHPDDLPRFLETVREFRSGTGEQVRVECRVVSPDGTDREVTITVSGIRNVTGKVAGYVAIVEELTERRRAERAEAENQAKSRFLALMSHELRTPLNAVLGFSQLLEHRDFGPLNDRQGRYVSNIKTAGQNLLTLVNDLLDFSKVSADRMDFHAESIDLTALVDETITSLHPSADDKKLSLEQTVEPGLTAYADRFRLRQVLQNLLSNGIKFTNTGSVKVTAEAAGDKACIAVSDTGIGIPADQLPRLFSDFSQLDSGISRSQQGTGLGLALSRRLVAGMGGTISVTSNEGEGSVFTVLVPRVGPTTE